MRQWTELTEAVRGWPVEMAVVDPQWRTDGLEALERFRIMFPSLPVLIYTRLAPETAGPLLALAGLGAQRALFYGLDDDPETLRSVLNHGWEQSVACQVLRAVTGLIQDVPSRLQQALDSTLCASGPFPTVDALAERAQVRRRTCERWFARRGLPSPRTVLILGRLLQAHRLLLDPGYNVEDVALKLGFRRSKTMQMHFREVFGMTAGEARLGLTPAAALANVASRYFAHPWTASQAAS
ncbi:MAG TPA: helix-turn-helix transcriptional regulator [Gemmatimonadales bacterium]|nr:helix-turn-helix transcriptional regulator [Gemmatimonadales bacterium]